ncbi:MAG: electron transfer flavoprotein subunit alpha/FixB family protein [Chitinophagaceae bacterium]|nr:electron transfer flavoprotein subunit alpha/FixB family protein [Chitinophagaceae bacterium]HEV8084791.1 electron transfer flavoprotein subunit alpha/FixB family protein [Chitinophagaceae bacterium]
MSVLIFLDQADGHIKKNSFEAACYGAKVAELTGTTAEGIVFGNVNDDLAALGNYGLKKIHAIKNPELNNLDAEVFTKIIADTAEQTGAGIIVFSNNMNGKSIAPRLSARMKAGLVSGAISLPDLSNGFVVKKNVFSGKAFANVSIKTDKKIISLNANAYKVTKVEGSAEVVEHTVTIPAIKVKVTAVNKVIGEVPLSEADLVISGGRGLKSGENWHLITDLAKELGAATACSRAVADADWRPHHEHVGQTGLTISPNMYFAVGISGAIQHLAGVNRSKVIVVINTDPEAPFFKAADYGIVGDAFVVMPKIIEAVKKLKASGHV